MGGQWLIEVGEGKGKSIIEIFIFEKLISVTFIILLLHNKFSVFYVSIILPFELEILENKIFRGLLKLNQLNAEVIMYNYFCPGYAPFGIRGDCELFKSLLRQANMKVSKSEQSDVQASDSFEA